LQGVSETKEKTRTRRVFCFGVADGAAHGAVTSRATRPSARTRWARATCASPQDLLVEPAWLLTSIEPPKQKTRTRRVLCFGVADGVRTQYLWEAWGTDGHILLRNPPLTAPPFPMFIPDLSPAKTNRAQYKTSFWGKTNMTSRIYRPRRRFTLPFTFRLRPNVSL
jgi:hypothetical protein